MDAVSASGIDVALVVAVDSVRETRGDIGESLSAGPRSVVLNVEAVAAVSG